MHKNGPLNLVPLDEDTSLPTVRKLEELLAMTKAGELIGIIYMGMKRGCHNQYSMAGQAIPNPLIGHAKERDY